MKPRKSSLETEGAIRGYIRQGLKPTEIAKIMGMSRQRLNYWIGRIRKNGKARS